MNRVSLLYSAAALIVAGLLLMAVAMAAAVAAYRVKSPRALPRRRRRIDWLPKYVIEVPIYCEQDDTDSLIREIRDWLGPWGFVLRGQAGGRLLFGRGSRLGDLTTMNARILVIVPLPVSRPAKVQLQYETGALFDTGDLANFARQLTDKHESAVEQASPPAPDTGNPYQAPG